MNHRFTDRLIYVSSHVYQEALASSLVSCGRATVIQNGIDLTPFADDYPTQAVREAHGTPLEATILCCIGRLDRQKGIDILLEAIRLLEPQRRNLHVWLVGDGPQRAVLEAQSRQLGLEASVQFLGFRNDVSKLLKASDIFVLPSRYEGMPVSILEAMAAGLPCVVTDVGDNAEVIQDGVTGRVVPLEDRHALASALNDLVLNAALRRAMGDAARQKAQRYDVKLMVDRTLMVYEQIQSD